MAFIETPRFPSGISYGSQGGPTFSTTIVTTRSGKTTRNQNWSYPLHVYNVLPGIKTATALEDVREYFYAMAGRANGFRFKDFADWKSCALGDTIATDDQTLGTGDSVETDYQLVKTYTKGALSMTRPIKKPVSGTLVIEVAGSPVTGGWNLATGTGIITFSTGIPATGEVVKAGYAFDVPVEFGSDVFSVTTETCNYPTGTLIFNTDTLPLRELRL